MIALVRKLLRDLRVPLVVVALLLAAFQVLWARVSQRITEELVPKFTAFLPLGFIRNALFEGTGRLMETLMGGESIDFSRALDMLSVGYVHPLVQSILCIWAVGRAAGALAGEIDRGTLELLLAQPIARWRVVAAHGVVDVLTIPLLCLSLWAGNWAGIAIFGEIDWGSADNGHLLRADPRIFAPGLWNVAGLLFAVSGATMALSAAGRFRGRVMATAVLLTLLQYLVNVIGQLWPAVEGLRPLTLFYYYQPQQIILANRWSVPTVLGPVNVLLVLAGVGAVGYLAALWTFCRRDLPAPL
ncbi:MAG: ABC transporter permease [Gemmataceae bacterium]|nr:ABC transporter permease [Gemmataceae bacterium]MDW8267449.1 ABC transporter permease subunit [Gemmataceae bacterium]